ncbi:hypothetical protein ACJJIF_20985 [Microbulbifer sp. SSSA002]|uniref:hypothetical protein n=1 Tax=Microbulbifer sp. SSSA002 TaxID=3243376 RepID=UPI00403950AF
MKKLLISFVLISPPVHSSGFPDGSELGTPEIAKCAAAALKIDMKTWKQWYAGTQIGHP